MNSHNTHVATSTTPEPYSFFFSSRRRHTRWPRDWSSDVCSSDLVKRQHRGSFGLCWHEPLDRSFQEDCDHAVDQPRTSYARSAALARLSPSDSRCRDARTMTWSAYLYARDAVLIAARLALAFVPFLGLTTEVSMRRARDERLVFTAEV